MKGVDGEGRWCCENRRIVIRRGKSRGGGGVVVEVHGKRTRKVEHKEPRAERRNRTISGGVIGIISQMQQPRGFGQTSREPLSALLLALGISSFECVLFISDLQRRSELWPADGCCDWTYNKELLRWITHPR